MGIIYIYTFIGKIWCRTNQHDDEWSLKFGGLVTKKCGLQGSCVTPSVSLRVPFGVSKTSFLGRRKKFQSPPSYWDGIFHEWPMGKDYHDNRHQKSIKNRSSLHDCCVWWWLRSEAAWSLAARRLLGGWTFEGNHQKGRKVVCNSFSWIAFLYFMSVTGMNEYQILLKLCESFILGSQGCDLPLDALT